MTRETLSTLRTPHVPMGVLTDNELLLGSIVGGKRVLQSRVLPLEASELSGLLEFLWQQKVTSVWVFPASQFSQRATCNWLQQANDQWTPLVHPSPAQLDRPISALFLSRGNNQRLTLAFPEYAEWCWTLPDAISLLATVTYLDQILARHMVESPQQSAHQLLTELTLKEPVSQLRVSPVDLWTLPDSQGRSVPLQAETSGPSWIRSLTLEEQRQRYLHKYTYFSLALRACQNVQLGAGTPQLSPQGRAFDGNRPGFWHVHLDRAGSIFNDKQLPGSLKQEWISTPHVVCCRNIGYTVQVQEGYSWPQSHQLLKPWATFLWQAVEQMQNQPRHFHHIQARANATQTIKQLAEHGAALLREPADAGGWSRPDWWAQVAGRQWALLFTDLAHLVRRGIMPILVDRDAFWVVSADPNPFTAVGGLLSTQRWNGFAPGYEVPLFLSKKVQDLFRSKEPVDQVVSNLDNLAEERTPL